MNDQGSKKILFNKSTLFSLKAELLRKQEEVYEKKQLPHNKVENFKPPPKVKENKNENKEYKKSFKDSLKAVDTEELEACRKSKSALEKKAELYEHLSDSTGNSQLASRFLVDFKTKKQENQDDEEDDIGPPIPDHVTESTENVDDDEWTEFTDCLGRTRKCHKSDIDLFLKRDKELMKVINKDAPEANVVETPPEEPTTSFKEKPLLVQKTNDYLQSLRDKWEQKEKELLAKDRDIHYQDLLFDEARIHGVGYYSFSTDETERQKQMEELIKQREQTLKAQEQAEQIRKKRDEMMAARVAAARARQRARAGLPPEEPPKENQKDFTTCLLEFLTQQKNEADAKANEEERKIKDEKEKERQKLREAYIREWDLGKEGVDEKVKKFREMSQEEYVEQQRDKRIDEFAPPQTSTSRYDNIFDDTGRMVGTGEGTAIKTWADVRPKAKTPPPPDIGDLNEFQQQGLYFSTKKKGEKEKYSNFVKAQDTLPTVDETVNVKGSRWGDGNSSGQSINSTDVQVSRKNITVKHKNYVPSSSIEDSGDERECSGSSDYKINQTGKYFTHPTPIMNEVDSDYAEEKVPTQNNERKRGHPSNSAEVPPPPTFEYYGPVLKQTKFKNKNPFESDIREAYAQGVKSLEPKPSSRQLSKDYDFCLD